MQPVITTYFHLRDLKGSIRECGLKTIITEVRRSGVVGEPRGLRWGAAAEMLILHRKLSSLITEFYTQLRIKK